MVGDTDTVKRSEVQDDSEEEEIDRSGGAGWRAQRRGGVLGVPVIVQEY